VIEKITLRLQRRGDRLNVGQQVTQKEAALESLGRLLPSYAALQAEYSSQVHMPDFRAFSERWESSLYGPIREEVKAANNRSSCGSASKLLYCGPGPHAPLVGVQSGSRLALAHITLLDIDASALDAAKRRMETLAVSSLIDTAAVDLSGPFGQRLCNVYIDALRLAETCKEVTERLVDAGCLAESIFADASDMVARLVLACDNMSGERRYAISVSEMVASFTGTAVWLGFRSALYEKFAGIASCGEMENVLRTATLLWQKYNERFLVVHLDFLKRQTAKGGCIVLVFDTLKVYDDPRFGSLAAFAPETSILSVLTLGQLRILRHTSLCWRDHPRGFDVKLFGFPVADFQAHAHDVELYVLEVAE
jgi:hypothetical protein